jgi:ferrochelatase
MAYGTPTTPEDVEAYYTRIRHGHAPSPELLADLVRRYNAIGGTSPLAERTAAQVAGLARSLERLAPSAYEVRFGSKYEPPLLEETAASFREDSFNLVIGLVLAPHSSSMSTDQYMSRAREALGPEI